MDCTITNNLWKLPKNYVELADSMSWAAEEKLSLNVDAPLWVTAELAEQESSNTLLLHLINFRNYEAVGNIPVQVRVSEGHQLREAVWETPEGEGRKTLNASLHDGMVSFAVPHLQEYALVLLRLEKE
jgi:hypothetical protein